MIAARVVVVALVLMLAPVITPALICEQWYARVCADERYTVSSWEQVLNVNAAANKAATAFLFVPANESSVDVRIDASISSGSGAAVALVNLDMLLESLNDEQEARLGEIVFVCIFGTAGECNEALNTFLRSLPMETYQASSAWWHGCSKKDTTLSKTIDNLERNNAGYVLAAVAQGGSSASATLTATHSTPHEITAVVCRPTQNGRMPRGTFQHRLVGTISLEVSPQHGGTVSNTRVSVTSPAAVGAFAVEGTNVYFTGSSDPVNCPSLCPTGYRCCEPSPRGGCLKCVKPPQVCP